MSSTALAVTWRCRAAQSWWPPRGPPTSRIGSRARNSCGKDLSWDGVPKGVEVGAGSPSSYESLRTQVLNYTNQAPSRCPGCGVHVAGHPLGGAQAFLSAADVKLLHNPTTRATTFGCPRVGNSDWGPWFASSVVPHATEDQFEWCTTAIVFPWHPLQQLVTFTYHTKSGKLLGTAHATSTARAYPQLVHLWGALGARPNMAPPRACWMATLPT